MSSSDRFFELNSKIRQKLLEKESNSIALLPKIFKSAPSYNGDSKISSTDFFISLEKYGVNLRKEDAVLLLQFFDKDNDGTIFFNDFLYSIRGFPNKERQSIIDLVYFKFDKNRTGQAETTELRKVFNCIRHPKFLMGSYSEDQIFYLFLKNFSDERSISYVKKQEWDDYYAGVSTTIDDDSHFIKIIKNQFKVE